MQSDEHGEYLTPDEAGRKLGMTGATVRRKIEAGEIAAEDWGPTGGTRSRWRIRPEKLDEYTRRIRG